jgi:hypothetical protein
LLLDASVYKGGIALQATTTACPFPEEGGVKGTVFVSSRACSPRADRWALTGGQLREALATGHHPYYYAITVIFMRAKAMG